MLKHKTRLHTAWSSVYSQTLSVMTCAKTLVSGMTFSSPESLHSTTDKNATPPPHTHTHTHRTSRISRSLTLPLSPVNKWKRFNRYTTFGQRSAEFNTLAPACVIILLMGNCVIFTVANHLQFHTGVKAFGVSVPAVRYNIRNLALPVTCSHMLLLGPVRHNH